MEQWQGRYSTPLGAKRIVLEFGSMAALVDHAMAAFGIQRTSTPKRGDIAVVDAPEGAAGAIVLDGSVARIREPSGIVLSPLPIIAAWSV